MTGPDCSSCGEGVRGDCSKSERPCGHHCNCSWDQDVCHWCGRTFGEDSAARESRGVQVEARTLSGVHLGMRVQAERGWPVGLLQQVEQDPATTVAHLLEDDDVSRCHLLQPTDLVTLTDGGAE